MYAKIFQTGKVFVFLQNKKYLNKYATKNVFTYNRKSEKRESERMRKMVDVNGFYGIISKSLSV